MPVFKLATAMNPCRDIEELTRLQELMPGRVPAGLHGQAAVNQNGADAMLFKIAALQELHAQSNSQTKIVHAA